MAVLISCATGNWLTAGTWALVDATSYVNSEAQNSIIVQTESSNRAAAGFTPGAITIDAIVVKISSRLGTATGTFSCQLWNQTDSIAVTGTLVTVNAVDVQVTTTVSEGGWFVFKFAAPVTLTAAKAYVISPVTSALNTIGLHRDSTVSNWSRALRTTTTQAPVAGDDLIVAGEHTGAGTGTDFTVTMNETASTDYGSNATSITTPALAICKRGTLKFNDGSAANPKLRLSGHAIVYSSGTLNIGTVATPIPRDSTSILEFDPPNDGDFGLRCLNGSTTTMQGLSRTSGKNVVACKLTANTVINQIQAASLGGNATATVNAPTTLDPTGTSLSGGSIPGSFSVLIGVTDTVTNVTHRAGWTGGSVTNIAQTFTVWIKRGSGTNNRYVRIQMGSTAAAPPTNGFYADVDLQAGTIGTCTAVGNGSASAATISLLGGGYVCSIAGTISTGAATINAAVFAANVLGGVTYAGDATQNFIMSMGQVYNQSIQPTDLTVDTDTGWLANDVVAIAATTRTPNDCEVVQLGSNAGASALTCALYPVNYHDGLSPVQAEVILVTRNVKMRSTSPSFMTYLFIDCPALGATSVDIDWTEFYYLGTNAVSKRGLEISYGATFAGAINIQYSSFRDCEALGLFFTGNIANTTFSNNTMWHLATTTGSACQIVTASTAVNYVIDSNILIHTGTGNGWILSDIGGTFTNNTIIAAASNGLSINETAAIGTFTGNVFHSNGTAGVTFAINGIYGIFGSCMNWRNGNGGIFLVANISGLIIDNATCFGNASYNLTLLSGNVCLKSFVSNGDTTFSTAAGILFSTQGIAVAMLIDNGNFSTVSGIKTAHAADINISTVVVESQMILRNTKLGATTEIATQSNMSSNGFIASQRHDQTAGNHKTWMRNGTIQTDPTTYNLVAPSLQMTPTSSSLKLESAPQFQGLKVAINNGTTATVSVYVRKSATYNGNQPRLIQKANPALGQNADVVLATLVGSTGSWIQMSGTTSTATDDGAWEIVVDCDGTAGAVNIDDFTVS